MTVEQDVDVHAPAKTYYTSGTNARNRHRTVSGHHSTMNKLGEDTTRQRRASHDDKNKARKFLLDVVETKRILVEQEDTDGDFQITVNDLGPKSLSVGSADSGGYRKIEIRGTYMLSNLLQELALAEDYGRKYIVLDEARLNENPVDRLSRMIRHNFWDGLTRRIDAEGLMKICADPKNRSDNQHPRIYVPYNEDEVFKYYQTLATEQPQLKLEVERLPQDITPEYVQSINDKPGLLTLALERTERGFQGVPFVVPGGRFNEMYGWDSYFESLGLLIDDRVDLARGMVDNFVYEINHYGKILNANRSYYLSRSQPPFLTDMARRIHSKSPDPEWLRGTLKAAIKEYHTVWMSEPRLDPKTQLSRYRPAGKGIPPETESSHFDHIIKPYAIKAELSVPEYMKQYNEGTQLEPDLDDYFLHDRAVRESGHDTTYRFDGCCANLATIDLNALLFKYERDIAELIEQELDGHLEDEQGVSQQPEVWRERAQRRREAIDKYLWNEDKALYFDYDTLKEEQITYESVTALWALWAGCASQEQAEKLVNQSLSKFEVLGGLVSGTLESRGDISLDRPNRQWDFPFGWAPHQILAWQGLENYGMKGVADRLAYRWLYMITKSFVDFNGVVPEKYDVVSLSHKVQVEYGTVGIDFQYVPREGFGWMNASYQIGLSMLPKPMRRALGIISHPETVFEKFNLMYPKSQEEQIQEAEAITENGQDIAAITYIGSIRSPQSPYLAPNKSMDDLFYSSDTADPSSGENTREESQESITEESEDEEEEEKKVTFGTSDDEDVSQEESDDRNRSTVM
ncbi:neutral trehalase [Pilobolus umbonatus]|nr:neutral trehalase [Pilobolus umbonatus]